MFQDLLLLFKRIELVKLNFFDKSVQNENGTSFQKCIKLNPGLNANALLKH